MQVKNFKLTMKTNFIDIDFPDNSISPTKKDKNPDGWLLTWKYSNLLSGFTIGLKMPEKLNPGELSTKISFFAPISLLFFFTFLFFITAIKNIKLHPMHYFFLGASFFSFHLLFAYTSDRIDVYPAFALASIISLFLVISYLRIVTGIRFTILYASTAQFVYLILFTFSHFFKGFTGLTITIASIITLYILMQLTAKIDWSKKFSKNE